MDSKPAIQNPITEAEGQPKYEAGGLLGHSMLDGRSAY